MKKFIYFITLCILGISCFPHALTAHNAYHHIAKLHLPSLATTTQDQAIDELLSIDDKTEQEKEEKTPQDPTDDTPTEKEQSSN